ncbi:50S ribosomal protein L15 [bacterium]|nr:50S ribosomal protein L15 [bacterium]
MVSVEFLPAEGSVKKKIRRGRGNSSGHGGESGRGHKGQKSRTGYSRRAGFEGGQMPLYRRLPKKRGFTRVRPEVEVVNVSLLENIEAKDGIIGIQELIASGAVKTGCRVKVLGNGDLSRKVTVSAHSFSASAVEKINKAGGSTQVLA